MATTEIINVSVRYEVMIQSDGTRRTGWPNGIWFYADPFLGTIYHTLHDAEQAITRYTADHGEFCFLPMRIMATTSVVAVVKVVR